MQAICPISGVKYGIIGIPTNITAPHPLLYISAEELLSKIYPVFKDGLLDPDTLHVFGIALIVKLPIEGKVSLAASDTTNFSEFWESQIPKLIPLCKRLDGKSFNDLPTIRVTIETLPHLPYWIDELHAALTYASMPISDEARRLNREGYKSSLLNAELDLASIPVSSWSQEEKDSLILRAIRGSQLSGKETTAFPQLIADWADKETQFPVTNVTLKDGKRTTIKAVWQNLITKSVRAGSSYLDLIGGEFSLDDIQELEAHLLCGLRSSSMQSKFLFEKLAEAGEVIAEFTGQNIIQSKPVSEPSIEKKEESNELYQMNHQPGERVLSLKEKLAIKLANARMKK